MELIIIFEPSIFRFTLKKHCFIVKAIQDIMFKCCYKSCVLRLFCEIDLDDLCKVLYMNVVILLEIHY